VTGALSNRWQEAKEEVVQGQGYVIAISITSTTHPTVTTISNSGRENALARKEPKGKRNRWIDHGLVQKSCAPKPAQK
jgi:hypothetical protein